VAIGLSWAAEANAAAIVWGVVTDETGNASDIITSGTFVESAYVGDTPTLNGDVTVNGVTFDKQQAADGTAGPTFTFDNGSNIVLHNTGSVQGYSFNSAPGGWNSGYRTLTSGADLTGGGNPYIAVGGLTVGVSYIIQILEPYWNANYPVSYQDSLGDNSGVLNLGSGNTTGQYVTGTFIADSTSEDVYMVPGSGGYELFGAIQVRAGGEAVPEPATIVILGVPMAALYRMTRRRRRFAD
jgi:hypothetical protein